jgi:8-oxo-dGTP pyrophosphatase MutT (NUDIX family)
LACAVSIVGQGWQKADMSLDRTRILLEPLVRRMMHTYWRFARGATLGVRGLVIDGDGRVFLVKHSYVRGWHLPGGGVETGETMLAALRRELLEEGNIELSGAPMLHGIYFNRQDSRRDHVALFVVRQFRQSAPLKPNFEIAASGFFARDELPEETTSATRMRIAEIFENKVAPEFW